jgi:hypothetical protein
MWKKVGSLEICGVKRKKIIIIKSQKPENKQAKTGARCYR